MKTLSVRIRTTRTGDAKAYRGDPGTPFSLDVSFEASAGITILFGPSGCGKSTTLAAIAGLLRPDEGRIALGGDVWFDSARGIDRPVHERGVALVFQSLALFPHMTAEANVAYGMRGGGAMGDKKRRALELLRKLGVAHLTGRKPATFSGGEAQRVALARAFAMSPSLALFDEPFSAMDLGLRRALTADVRAFAGELDIPLIHVTHRREEARELGDRVIVLEGGRIANVGATNEILRGEGRSDCATDDP